MKLTSKIVPYSSIVGGGLMLMNESGHAAFIVSFRGTTDGITKQETKELTDQFNRWIAEYGLIVSPR